MKKELGWEVKVLPVQIKGKSDVLNKALVRSDDESLIGIRGKYYHPVFNKDLELLKKKILKSGHFNFKGYEEFQNGKRILAFFENRSKFSQKMKSVKILFFLFLSQYPIFPRFQ